MYSKTPESVEDDDVSITLSVIQKGDDMSDSALEAHIKNNTKRLLELNIKTIDVLYTRNYMREFQVMALAQSFANFCVQVMVLSEDFRPDIEDRSLIAKAVGLQLQDCIAAAVVHAEHEIEMAKEMATRGANPGMSSSSIN